MAEAFGVGAGIVGVLGLTIQISQVVVQFGLDWKDAPAAVRSFMAELQSLKSVLSETNTNLALSPEFQEAFQDRPSVLLSHLDPNTKTGEAKETRITIEACKGSLEELLTELKKRKDGSRMGWQRLKGHFLAPKTREAMDRLRHHCQLFNNMVSVDTATLSAGTFLEVKAVSREQKEWHNAEENQKILRWLSDLSFEQKQADVFSKCHPGTGQWLLKCDRFMAWRNGHRDCSPVLWCPGIPGAGKSVMTSIVVDSLKNIFTSDDVSIAYVYCDYKDRTKQTTLNLLSSLVKQQVLQQREVPAEVRNLCAEGHGQVPLSLEDCTRLLSLLSTHFRRAFILVDALDEHLTNDDEENILQIRLLDELLALQWRSENEPGFTLLFTSRENRVIEQKLAGCVRIDIRAMDDDVESYTRARIEDETKFPFARDVEKKPELGDTIVTTMVEKAQGMFLLPRLHLDRLCCQTDIRGLRTALGTLPSKLNDTYQDAMSRILGQVPEHKDLAISALSWISSAVRPLKVDEIKEALAIQPGDRDLDCEGLKDESRIVSVSAGLITVDAESSTIRLVHFTVDEFFNSTKHIWFPDADSFITETCLTYLSFDVFQSGIHAFEKGRRFRRAYRDKVLLSYAAPNWPIHARRGVRDSTENVIVDFLMDDKKANFARQAAQVMEDESFLNRQISGLHLAAYYGLEITSRRLLASGQKAYRKHGDGRTPLKFAAENGHEAVVGLLLDQNDLEVKLHNGDNSAPVKKAITEEFEMITQLLLDRDAIITENIEDEGRALSCAARKGHEAIVKLLLDRNDIVADSKSKDGRTPLSYAAWRGHEAIVKLLLDRNDVVADSKDKDGRTPLLYAAWRGHEAIVKLLLDRNDIATDSKDKDGRTPLLYAAWRGHEAIVKLLLDRNDIATDSEDKDGRTPLLCAAAAGHEAIVKLLLDRNDVVADFKDEDGRTPLLYAAEAGHEAIVKLLLDRNDVIADSKDEGGCTPLSYAAEAGHEAIVKLLLDRNDVTLVADLKDEDSRTPLSCAAEVGHEAIFKLLLDRNDVVADFKDEDGRTPLLYAAWRGHEAIVKLLLARNDIATDFKDKVGRTPLSYAAAEGHEAIVKLLLDRNDVVADSKDEDGCTPLLYAAEAGHEAIVKLLLARNDIDINRQDIQGRTPLFHAAAWGWEVVVQLMLDQGDVDLYKKNNKGRTPLSVAANRGHPAVVKLLEQKIMEMELRNNSGT